jgi:hypothetical protein
MAARKQSSARMSKIGGRVMNMTDQEISDALSGEKFFGAQLRALGASVVGQDETPKPKQQWCITPPLRGTLPEQLIGLTVSSKAAAITAAERAMRKPWRMIRARGFDALRLS